MTSKDTWFLIDNMDKLDTPCLVVYPDRVRQNIATLLSMVDDPVRLRPHVKTHKTKECALMLMAAGVQKFKCATISEAEMLGMCKAKDVLLAYQPVGPKLRRFIQVVNKYKDTQFSCLVDNKGAAMQMAEAFAAEGLSMPVFLDLNVGMNRTGIAAGEKAADLYGFCTGLKGMRPVGLHAYDGHIRDADLVQRKIRCDEAFAAIENTVSKISAGGFGEPVIIAGGSPTFSIHSKRKKIECSPGTFIFWDKGYADLCPEQAFVPAALVVTRVISLPDETKLCLDLGHKSIAAENELSRRVHFLNAPDLKAIGQSEEHLVLEIPAGHGYQPGDVLYGLPQHICPTIALYERAYLVTNHFQEGEWKIIARDRVISI